MGVFKHRDRTGRGRKNKYYNNNKTRNKKKEGRKGLYTYLLLENQSTAATTLLATVTHAGTSDGKEMRIKILLLFFFRNPQQTAVSKERGRGALLFRAKIPSTLSFMETEQRLSFLIYTTIKKLGK